LGFFIPHQNWTQYSRIIISFKKMSNFEKKFIFSFPWIFIRVQRFSGSPQEINKGSRIMLDEKDLLDFQSSNSFLYFPNWGLEKSQKSSMTNFARPKEKNMAIFREGESFWGGQNRFAEIKMTRVLIGKFVCFYF